MKERFYLRNECCAIYVLRLTDGVLMGRSRTPKKIAGRCVKESGQRHGGRVVGLERVFWFVGAEAANAVSTSVREFVEDKAGVKMSGDSRTPVYAVDPSLICRAIEIVAEKRRFEILSEKQVMTERGYKQAVMGARIAAGMYDEEGPKIHLGGAICEGRSGALRRAPKSDGKYF